MDPPLVFRQGLSLRVSVTDRCQLRCGYCMPPEGVACGGRNAILSYEEIASLAACLHRTFGIGSLRLTGGEPLLRPGIEKLIGMLAALDLPDLTLTTNGLRLASLAPAMKQAGLNRVNISLDSLSPAVYRELTGGGDLWAVLRGIEAARAAGLNPVKLNTVVIGGVNDAECIPLLRFALDQGCELRFIELMPIGPGADWFQQGFVASATVRQRLSAAFSLKPLSHAPGTSASLYEATSATGARGRVGFIASCSAPFCADCRRLRILSDGRLVGCLARGGGIAVRDLLRRDDRDGIVAAARQAMLGKRNDHRFSQPGVMAAIGG